MREENDDVDRSDTPPADPATEAVLDESLLGGPRTLTVEQRAYIQERAQGASRRLRPIFFQRNAELLASVGDVDGAITAASGAVESDLIDLGWFEHCPPLAPLRRDPRWAPLREIVHERAQRILDALRSGRPWGSENA